MARRNSGCVCDSLTEFRDSTRLDSASRFGNPQFVSATDAHISTTFATPVESGGRIILASQEILTVTFGSDHPDTLVQAPRPDIGADEGEFIRLSTSHDIGVAFLGTTHRE